MAEFQLAAKVQGLTSFKEMAENTPLTESMATRLIRHAITMRIFCEPQVGFVAHTAASKLLANPAMNDYLLSVTRERWPAATKASLRQGIIVQVALIVLTIGTTASSSMRFKSGLDQRSPGRR